MIKSHTDLDQSKKLAEILPLESADMIYVGDDAYIGSIETVKNKHGIMFIFNKECIPCWSLVALLTLIPKHILRKNKIHCGQAFIPSFRWEISPTAIYYTDGNKIMDYVSFKYGENNIELIDAVFKMVVWLKKK